MPQKRRQTMTRSEFAELIGRTPQAVSQWIQAGMPARNAGTRGKAIEIDIEAAVPWVVKRIMTPLPERERLAKEQADKIALENEKTRAGLIHRHHVEQSVNGSINAVDEVLADLPDTLADPIAGTSDPAKIRSMIQDSVRHARAELADRLAKLA